MAQTRRSTARGLEQVPSRRLSAVPAEEAASAAARRGKRRGRIKYRIFTLGLGLDMTMLFLILVLLAVGLAAALWLWSRGVEAASVKTVSVHVSNVLAKLGASGRTEAAAIARRQGLLRD